MAGFAAFSLFGIFNALVPTFLRDILHENNHAVAGAVVFMFSGVAVVTQLGAGQLAMGPCECNANIGGSALTGRKEQTGCPLYCAAQGRFEPARSERARVARSPPPL